MIMHNISNKKKKYFRQIIKFLDENDIYRAKNWLDVLPQVPYKKYFYNRIKEKETSPVVTNKYLDLGRNALIENNFELAYDYFTAGKYLTENPLFDYYLGKTFFTCDMLEVAMNYFNDYRFTGSIKLNKCYFYLFIIATRLGYKTNKKYIQKVREINDFLNLDFSSKKKHEEKINLPSKEPKEDSCKEEVNLHDEELQEKLEYIKSLLLRKKEHEANNLLKKIKVSSKKEREILNQFEKNKRLYLNKAK